MASETGSEESKKGTWRVPQNTYDRICALGLERQLAELEAYGITVIPPEAINIPDYLDRLRRAVLRLAKVRTGVEHVVETGAHGEFKAMGANESQYVLFALLTEDPVFEELVCFEKTLALIDYYLGEACQLSSLASFIKWPNAVGYGDHLGLHCDGAGCPPPLPHRPHVFNTNWILTDYTKADGAFCVVPGSHAHRRMPTTGEGVNDAIAVEAPAGSVLVFHGHVWHGAFPKLTPGLRLSVNAFYCGSHYRPQENFRGRISEAMLARNPKRFRSLVGYEDPWGFQDLHGPVPYYLRGASERSALDTQSNGEGT